MCKGGGGFLELGRPWEALCLSEHVHVERHCPEDRALGHRQCRGQFQVPVSIVESMSPQC